MPFCPSCKAEYRPGVAVCENCKATLVERLEGDASSEEMVDIYVCYDAQLVDRVAELLRDAAIEPLLSTQASSPFPTTIGRTNEHRIAVATSHVAEATEIIDEAIDDGIIAASAGELIV